MARGRSDRYDTTPVGALLKPAMDRLGVTFKDIGTHIGVAPASITRKLRLDYKPPFTQEQIEQIAEYLELSDAQRDELLSWYGYRKNPASLPSPISSFVGREEQMTELPSLLLSTRLVTLTGAGGSGKTRLALEAGSAVRPGYSGGVWFVPLAALRDAALIPQAIASVLGVRERGNRPLIDEIAGHFQPRHALLILDNAEHMVDACRSICDTLLGQCPQLCIMVTSREVLGIAGEVVREVPPLSLPTEGQVSDPVRLMQSEAARLFIDRAREKSSRLRLTAENAAAVADICRKLDGLPLAIEIAAARARALDLLELAGRLEGPFRLTMELDEAAARHRTLQAALDWSYFLLRESEQLMLQRVSVFAGGWTLEAAETVCAGAGITDNDVLPLLARLVDTSFVVAGEEGGTFRYRLLEPVRQYAAARLEEVGDGERVRLRHAEFVLAFAREGEQKLKGSEQAEWLARLEREHDNVRAALGWLSLSRRGEAGLELAATTRLFWDIHGHWSEGRGWLDRLLAGADDASPRPVADALSAAGILAFSQSDFVAARAYLDACLVIRREQGSERDLAATLNTLGNVATRQSDYILARALLEESLALWRRAGDSHGEATTLSNLGIVARRQGQFDDATELYEQSLAIRRHIGDHHGTAMTLANLGNVHLDRGEIDVAYEAFDESLAIRRSLGDQSGVALVLDSLGAVATYRGDFIAARTFLRESIQLWEVLGDGSGVANGLRNLALVELRAGDLTSARALLEQALIAVGDGGDHEQISDVLDNLGIVAREQHRFGDARSLHEQSLAMRRAMYERPRIAESLENLATLALREERSGEAGALFREALALSREIGAWSRATDCIEGLSATAITQREWERAARLIGAAERLREASGIPLTPRGRAEHDQSLAVLRSALGDERLAEMRLEGHSFTRDHALAYALHSADPQKTN